MGLRSWSLRARLLGLVLLAMLPAFALIAWHQAHHVEGRIADALVRLSGLAQTAALARQRLLESARLLLVGVSEAPIVRGLDGKRCSDYLAGLRVRIPYAANLGVADLQGNLRCSAVPAAPGVNISDRAYFREALARNDFAVGGHQVGRATGAASIGFGLPVRNPEGKVHGVAFVAFDLDIFSRLTDETPLPDGAVILTTDRNGAVLSVRPAGAQKLGARANWEALDQLIQSHGNETRELRAADGTDWLYATVEVHVGGSRALSVAIGAPKELVVGPAQRAAAQELAVLAAALLAALGLAWFGYERAFVQPVRGFLQTVQRIARGELGTRAPPPPGSVREFTAIQEAFNEMAAALEMRDRRLSGLLEISADWYWEQGADLRFTAFSANLGERGNMAQQDFLGKLRWEIPFEDVSEEQWREHRALLDARQPFRDFVVVRRDRDGAKHYLSISGRPRFDAAGAFLGYSGVTRDVTALRASEGRYRALFELSPDAVFVHSQGRITLINNSGARMYGAAGPEALRGASILDLVAESHREDVRARLARLDQADGPLPIAEIPQRRLDGSEFVGEVYTTPYEGEGRRSYVTEVRDVTERRNMEQALRESETQYRTLFEKSPIPMWVFSLESLRFLAVNDAAVSSYGYAREEFLAMSVGAIRPAEDVDKLLASIQQSGPIRDAGIWRHRKKDGTLIDVHIVAYGVTFQGKAARLVLATDVTERLKYEARIEYLATHDGLTELPNRNLFADRLAQAITIARRAGQRVGVLLLDLDNFKVINDSFGHSAGDTVVKGVAARLSGLLRAGDTVARFGGDEFVVMLTGLGHAEDSALVIRKIQEVLAQPFHVEGTEVFVTASIGVSTFPADGDDMATLLRNADVAMYKAKELGRNGAQFFASDFSTRAVERLEMEAGLRRALERREFEIHYQPQVDLYTRRIFSAEALIRWRHPQRGLVPPGQFIQAAEDTGLIVPIGNWMLRAACTQLTQWRAAGLPEIQVSVNVSARQFRDKTLADNVRSALEQAGLAPGLLELELTEGLAMGDVEGFVATLNGLKALGIGIAIDDFGTGYSSLSYLKRFPIDKLKIDQSFVRNLPGAEGDVAIVRTVIALARSLRLGVIAEGVETWEQLEFLRTQGCAAVQGFYFGRPVPAEQFALLLGEGIAPALWEAAR